MHLIAIIFIHCQGALFDMDFSRYDKGLAMSPNNIIKNNDIIEGRTIKYFNVKGNVLIEKVDHRLGIVKFKQTVFYNNSKSQHDNRWYDYFMDANCFILGNAP